MAPSTALEEAKRASKRKLEEEDYAKRKRAKKDKSRTKQNEANGLRSEGNTQSSAPCPNVTVTESKKQRKRARNKDRTSKTLPRKPWKVSQPMGGRMVDIDPIMTDDEKHLILAYNTSIQVFSTLDSLLIRKVSIPISFQSDVREEVIAARLSVNTPNLVWVASSSGRIWVVDWTTGTRSFLKLKCDFLSDLLIESIEINGEKRDILLVSIVVDNSWRIQACDIQGQGLGSTKVLITRQEMVENLCSVKNGRAFAASAEDKLLLGVLKSVSCASFSDLVYEIFILDCSDEITCLDMRATERIHLTRRSQNEAGNEMVVDVVVGCARGAIFCYNDLLLHQLRLLQAPDNRGHGLQPRKFHWHRKAVHAVKWSQDGNYVVSGGSESVLVQWQLDTGKRDVLPHLSASIENIVISKRGSSYIVHLDDNSTMVLSTAEMKPTAYVSGVQSLVYPTPGSKDNLVARVGHAQTPTLVSRTPAAINPVDSTRLLVCVGNGQQMSQAGAVASTPLLQTMDLSTNQSIAKQAMTRTNPTDVNITPKGYAITEPRVTHLAYSHDGKWLATVDEWQPPPRDTDALEGLPSSRREVHLKFWTPAATEEQSKEKPKGQQKEQPKQQSLELVSRINAPHYTGRSEAVLDLAADPSSHKFATIGEDGVVRIWQPATRQRDGLVIKSRSGRGLQSWVCSQKVYLQENKASTGSGPAVSNATTARSGAVSFSKDGSILACAFKDGPDSTVYIVDAESGKVVNSIDGLVYGDVQGILILASNLVVLSEDIVVYSIVLDEMSYGIRLNQDANASTSQKLQSQLAVDHHSGTFVVAISRPNKQGIVESELAVFNADQCEPEIVREFPLAVVSVMAAPDSSGFLVLDSGAQLWSITQGTDPRSIALAQPLADINLDNAEEARTEDADQPMVIINEDEDVVSGDEMELDAAENDVEGDGVYPVVVAPQKLAELFNAAPAFAMPPIEDMFNQVTKLFSSKPATTITA
ncbi:uncharacterized protein BCR38DRAFT_464014 [Pseudomassariella vexata]|uniref:Quinon protein alcohol dehydrogenase-like superfamily n=1 Tax=Pseudomassariella vexata TaxID=1141098 RepID=A0A1Y2EB17_9PEZI|nr:uncharacterized protein BCR38DRAFT_464014 [Pseudomassariella vexata]ORY68607.1 hypothetical protein BCR38DRAFT_464014 [Pseudomassariella vexata]